MKICEDMSFLFTDVAYRFHDYSPTSESQEGGDEYSLEKSTQEYSYTTGEKGDTAIGDVPPVASC